MPIISVRGSDPTQFTGIERPRHERELRTVHHGRSGPNPALFRLGQFKQCAPLAIRIRHGLLAPDVATRFQGDRVESSMLLHIRQVDEQLKGRPVQLSLQIRKMMRHVILGRAPRRPLRDDVARAHQFDVGTFR